MLYILNYYYAPNTASSNRLLGYYSYLDNNRCNACIVFLLPNEKSNKLPNIYKHIKIYNLWKYKYIKNPFVRFVRFYINLWQFYFHLKSGDIVYTYTINKVTRFISKIRGVRVIAEITEHPSITTGGRIFSLSEKQKYQISNKIDKLFVISTALRNLFIDKGVSEDKIEIVNMTVDPLRFEGLKKEKVKERYIAYCGTASNNKDGVDELIKAFAIVAKVDASIKLYIIGKTPSKVQRFENYELVKSLKLENQVVFTGLVPSEKIPQLLINAEILALNRPDNEQAKYGFPTKLGEYLLTGNPVVVTSVGDVPLFLKDMESALIAKPSDLQDFSDKLLWAINNKVAASQIGSAGKMIALKYFNANIEAEKIFTSI